MERVVRFTEARHKVIAPPVGRRLQPSGVTLYLPVARGSNRELKNLNFPDNVYTVKKARHSELNERT